MTIGPTIRLTCPNCWGHKYIESISSGNTFRGTIWSDSKKDYPMLRYPSPIQKCPACGGYFFYGDATVKEEKFPSRHDREAGENGYGDLTEKESGEAYKALWAEDLSRHKRDQILTTRLYAFNDEYLREEDSLPKEMESVQAEFAARLMDLYKGSPLFVAELLRETGRFDEAALLLRDFIGIGEAEDEKKVARMMLERAENRDRTVFIVAQW